MAALVLWGLVYSQLVPFSDWVVSLLPIDPNSHLGEALGFFVYDTPKVLMLLTLVVFGMGVVRSFFSPEKTRALLAGKREGVGNVLAAGLGIVTPFCSCSAVPLFIGFVSAGVPLGVTFSFLISAPMVNEVALGLLFGLVGWKVALTYLGFGLAVAIVGGLGHRPPASRRLAGGMGAQHPRGRSRTAAGKCHRRRSHQGGDRGRARDRRQGLALDHRRHRRRAPSSTAMCRPICWPAIMGRDAWWSVPAAVLIGIPDVFQRRRHHPGVEALLGKGAALGTVLAFMMSVIALSLPEMIILRKVLTLKLIAVFVGVVGTGILAVGFLFNALFD